MSDDKLHFILTFTWSLAPNSYTTSQIEGLTPRQGTRQEVYRSVCDFAKQIKNIPDHAVMYTNFFSLEPNEVRR